MAPTSPRDKSAVHSLAPSAETGPSEDVICITGIAGSFPESNSVYELAENLYNKVDLVTDDDRRWKKRVHPDVPHRSGIINNVEKFDASFFGLDYNQTHSIFPMSRIILERVYEAIIDAGYNPSELRNTKTGVFIGISFEDSEKDWVYHKMDENNYCTTGCSRSTIAPRISQWLGLKGPCYGVDTACSSSLFALEHAAAAIRNRDCDSAIVGGVNLTLYFNTTRQFYRMGVLSPDGRCKSFDSRANGYVRSEAIAAVFLQKAKDSRRIYAQLVHTKTNCDGYKEEGITYPAGDVQAKLLEDFYSECNIPPTSVEYIEAHATGTKVGDPEELKAIDRIFCTGRSEPLLIGSVKSNLGHTESSSGICSIAKLCIAYTYGNIPPNIHFIKPTEGITALTEGRLKVVTEKTPWNRGMAGISSFGFGGANAHVLLRNIAKIKLNKGLPLDDLPRLVCVSGRTESAVAKILNNLESRTVDVEEIRLWHAIHEQNITGHDFRGFVLLGTESKKSIRLHREIQRVQKTKKPACFVYSNVDSKWCTIARQLLPISAFASSIQKSHTILKERGFDLIKLIIDSDSNKKSKDNFSIVAAVAIQIALTDILNVINIKPDYIIGHGVGELVCAYSDGCMSLEETILAAASMELTNKTVNDVNSTKTVQYLQEIIEMAKPRSKHWLSMSFPQVEKKPSSEMSSVEYLANSVKVSVLSEESLQVLPSNTVMLEFGLKSVLSPVVTNDFVKLALLDHRNSNSLQFFLTTLGRIFEAGLNPQLAKIYPAVQFPVAQGTPMLAHLVEWDHSENWPVLGQELPYTSKTCESTVKFALKDDSSEYLEGHKIDGRVIYPATGYLFLAWKTLAQILGKHQADVSVVFEDVYLKRATNMSKDAAVSFTISIERGSGNFEISENSTSVVTGRIYEKENEYAQDHRVIPTIANGQTKNTSSKYEMSRKDFYKELNLRGYEYTGKFRGVYGCSVDGTRGLLEWDHNWVTFLDSMLQAVIVTQDSRNLYLPTRIEKLSINTKVHNAVINKLETEELKLIPYQLDPDVNKTRCGGVEIQEVHVTAVSKKNPLGIPVLEKNEFVPNFADSNIQFSDSLRSKMQLILENIPTNKFKIIELVDKEYEDNNFKPAIAQVGEILADIPLIQSELLVLTEKSLDLPSTISVSSQKLSGESNVTLVMGANLLSRPNILEVALSTLNKGCFILSQEISPPSTEQHQQNLDIISAHCTGSENLVLLRKKIQSTSTKYIEILTTDKSYSWINKIKEALNDKNKIVLFSQNEKENGLLGFVNCMIKESGTDVVKGLLILDPNAPKFNPEHEFYKKQLAKDLTINIYKNSQWGTYRHLLLKELDTVPATHAYVNSGTIGDLTSLNWWQGPIINDYPTEKGKSKIHVYSSALNFRDVMIATGRVTVDAVARGRLAQQCVQGIEIAGRNNRGERVMAICNEGISNIVEVDETSISPIPDEWTFEEAATVLVAYYTVYMALVMVGKIRSGERILIHAGSGGVGQAAINVALHHGLEVFTTVGTPAKRALIKRLFPRLQDSHIGNSRDTSFEQMILRETKGQGVDLVLNSLSDEKLQASARCLRRRGRFLEIGKYDITANTQLKMCLFKKEISFHGIMLDYISNDESVAHRIKLRELLMAGIASGAVRPLTQCAFEKHEVEAAYRYMAAGKHVGKVIIKIRKEENGIGNTSPSPCIINAIPRYTCNKNDVYVLVGGLGGFGLELADWLVLRGARKLVLCSRRGISNGYQAYRIRIWSSYGTDVQISTHEVNTEKGCEEMLKMAAAMGTVKAIFNLAVVLNDALFTNQTPETFRNSFEPKAATTMNLDKLSRRMCPHLRDFVVFSSVSCGRGNTGQTNYGFSNSVMERICEERKSEGFPALAIQWGAIGDVGLVADMREDNQQIEIGGTLLQRISSCLQTLDKFLKQNAPIVSSVVVAEKRMCGSSTGNVVDAVAAIIGIPDLKTVSQQVALSELGMDSIMAVEIKQTLEQEFEIFLDAQEIRKLTFAKLLALSAQIDADSGKSHNDHEAKSGSVEPVGLSVLIRNLGDEATASEPYIDVPSLATTKFKDDKSTKTIFLVAGIEGAASSLEPLCRKLTAKTCVLQLGLDNPRQDMEDNTDKLYKLIKPRLAPKSPFYLLGYSYGTLPILRLALRLESEGHRGTVFCLDGSPAYVHTLVTNHLNDTNDYTLENSLILYVMKVFLKSELNTSQILANFDPSQSLEERARIVCELCPPNLTHSLDFLIRVTVATTTRCKHIFNFKETRKLKSPIVLLRVENNNLPSGSCDDDYGLHVYTESGVTTHFIEGDHVSITDKDECADIINAYLSVGTKTITVDTNVGKEYRIGAA